MKHVRVFTKKYSFHSGKKKKKKFGLIEQGPYFTALQANVRNLLIHLMVLFLE